MSTPYKHNPYTSSVLASKPLDHLEDENCAMDVALSGLSDGDHSDAEGDHQHDAWGREDSKLELSGQIPFYKYNASFHSANEGRFPVSDCVRLFAGQLPYQMPPSAVLWLLWVVTGVHAVKVEKIIRWKKNRQPCGCFHVYCLPHDEAALLRANELSLIDGDGVWVAEGEHQVDELRTFCKSLLLSKEMRATGMPYQLVTIQPARSTYARPAARRALHTTARQEADMVQISFCAPPPPPAYFHATKW